MYLEQVEKVGGKLQNTVIDTYPGASQFWKWSAEKYMAMPGYNDLKGKWIR